MEIWLKGRTDLLSVFNAADFRLWHFAKGYYPVSGTELQSMSVNRMFFPLRNPNGPENFIEEKSRRYELVPGRMYFVPAFLPAHFQLDKELFFLSIQASLELFPGVELFSDCPQLLEIPVPPEFGELMEIFDDADPQRHCRNALRAGNLTYSILLRMLDQYDPQDFWKPLALRKYAGLTEFLERRGNAATTVSDLASEMKMSRENFTRHFITDTGLSPKQLIDRFVIRNCLSLIQQNTPFKEIARQMQFRDVFAFSRYFKRNMGESPGNWRKRWIN